MSDYFFVFFVKLTFKSFNIDISNWEFMTKYRKALYKAIHQGAQIYGVQQMKQAQDKRAHRKLRPQI